MRSPSQSLPRTAPARIRKNIVDIFDDADRPLTAPSLVGPVAGYPSRASVHGDVLVETSDCEVDDDGREEPEVLLDKVSTVLHDLQSRWAEEREQEIRQLWQQMEAEYGMEISRCAPGTPAVGSLRAKAGSGAPGFLSGKLGMSEDDLGANLSVIAPEHVEEETEDDVVTEAARRDLEASRAFRRHMEARLATFSAANLDTVTSTSSTCSPSGMESEADAARLAQLRLEVENLRAKAAAPSVLQVDGVDNLSRDKETDVELIEPPLSALHDWMDDVWASSFSLSKIRGKTPRATASPQHGSGHLKRATLSRSSPSTPTKKEMARLAEEKAMEWNEGRHKGLSKPSSPTKKEMARLAEEKAMGWNESINKGLSPRLKLGPNSPGKSPEKPIQLAKSGTRLHESISSPKAIDPKPVMNSASTVEDQLDELLKELDEIDRIHGDVCMLAKP
jgi:hypothetical protein